MANAEHVRMLLAATASGDYLAWNQWRKDNPDLVPDLTDANLRSANLRCFNLSAADLRRADLSKSVLAAAKLGGAKLVEANLSDADLSGADLKCAHLMRADLSGANLTGADLRYADLRGTNLTNARLSEAVVDPGALRRAVNPPPDRADPTGSRRNASLRDDSSASTTPINRKHSWFAAAASGLSKLASAFVRHEDLTTLRLSKHEESEGNQTSARPEAAGPPPDETRN